MHRTFHVLYLCLYFRKEKYSNISIYIKRGTTSKVRIRQWKQCYMKKYHIYSKEFRFTRHSRKTNFIWRFVIYQKGKYTDNVWAYYYELLSLNVGVQKVKAVITNVLSNIIQKSAEWVPSIPSHATLCDLMIKSSTVVQALLGEKLTREETKELGSSSISKNVLLKKKIKITMSVKSSAENCFFTVVTKV